MYKFLLYYVCRAIASGDAAGESSHRRVCACLILLGTAVSVCSQDATCLAPLFRLANVSGGHLNKGVIGVRIGSRSLSRRCVASSDRLHERASDGHRPRGRIGDVTLRWCAPQ